MNHLDEGTIHAWLDGALDAEQSRSAESHVHACPRCAEAVAEARGLIAASSRILGALDDVPANVIPIARATKPRSMWRAAPWVTGIAAALVAAVVLRTDAPRSVQPPPVAPVASLSDTQSPMVVAPPVNPPAPVPERLVAQRVSAASGSGAAAKSVAAPRAAVGAVAGRTAPLEEGQVTSARAVPEARVSADRAQELAAAPAPPPTSAAAPARRSAADMRAMSSDVANVGSADPATLAGCYALELPTRAESMASGFAAASTQRRAERAAAPSAAAARMGEPSRTIIVRLDTLSSSAGNLVRLAPGDSSIGSWRRVAPDSARLDLRSAGTVTVGAAQGVACPQRPE